MKLNRSTLLLIFLFLSVAVWSQGVQRKVRFMVTDLHDGYPLTDYTATLMTADSTVIKTVVAQRDTTMMFPIFIRTSIPFTGKGKFILRLTSIGYETLDTPFEIKSNRQAEIDLHMLKMNPESKLLNEVVVTGTKIKMVMRGDTVVFNADAFKLAEGSMLDALIAQFPGAELNSDGEIKVNGRKIESLLVDGKDFFAGDPKAALKNLPAYTVNKVNVFDRDGKDTEMMGRDMGDRQYVMDVRLKKQYQRSLMGNIRAGAGTDQRFLVDGMMRQARGKSSIGITTRLNNVNDLELYVPGAVSLDMLRSMQNPSGVSTNRSYGLSYVYGEFSDPFSINVTTTISHNNSANDTWTSSQTYLAGGDTYGRSSNTSRNRNINWRNNMSAWFSPKGLNGHLDASFVHTTGSTRSSSLSASFDQDPSAYSDILHDVFDHPERYRAMTLNMSRMASLSESTSNNANVSLTSNFKVGSDMIRTNVDFIHSHSKNERFSLNDLRYPKNSLSDFRHEYNPAPTNSTSLNVGTGYDYALGHHSIGLNYRFGYQYNNNESMLYRLDRLAQSDSTTLDMLPSVRDVLRDVIDHANSYNYDSRTFDHTLSIDLRWKPIENKKQIMTQGVFEPTSGDLMFSLSLPLNWQKRDMNYFRQRESRVDQSNLFLNPAMSVTYRKSDNKGLMYFSMNASVNTSAPDMLSLIDFRDDSNPLNIRLGNPNLKNSHMYHVNIHCNNLRNKHQRRLGVGAHYTHIDNQMAYSMVYDKVTGVQTTKPTNVNGNWNAGADITFGRGSDMFMKKKDVFSIENQLGFEYSHNIDLASVAGQDESVRSAVNNSSLTDNLEITYRFGSDSEVSLKGSATYKHTTGDRADFNTIKAGDFSYGVSGVIALPWKLQLVTDITNFCHRGYSASEMNTDELIWNATLTKTLMKGALLFSLKGTDLLGNLKDRKFNIDEQGRTETFTNVIPRYVMLSVSYRFNKMPKNQRKPNIWLY